MNIYTLIACLKIKIKTVCYLGLPTKQNKYSPLQLAANKTKHVGYCGIANKKKIVIDDNDRNNQYEARGYIGKKNENIN
jgi:hypothetical protein